MALEPSSQTRANYSDSEHNTQWNTCYGTVTLFLCVCLIVSHSLRQFRAYKSCHKPRRARSLRLAAAYTSYGSADKIIRRLMKSTAAYGGGKGLYSLCPRAIWSRRQWISLTTQIPWPFSYLQYTNKALLLLCSQKNCASESIPQGRGPRPSLVYIMFWKLATARNRH